MVKKAKSPEHGHTQLVVVEAGCEPGSSESIVHVHLQCLKQHNVTRLNSSRKGVPRQ